MPIALTMKKKRPEDDYPQRQTRITVDLHPSAYSRLEKLAERLGEPSKAAVIRRALEVLEAVVVKVEEGYEFYAVSKTHDDRVLFVGVAPAEPERRP